MKNPSTKLGGCAQNRICNRLIFNKKYFCVPGVSPTNLTSRLTSYINKYPKAKTALLTWYHEFSKGNFRNFNELKAVYGNASIVANNRVIFNIKGNDFRLVTSVNFRRLAAYVIWFGTHKEYDKIDTSKISFDIEILNFKNK
jgi:mRNA interferase HigB